MTAFTALETLKDKLLSWTWVPAVSLARKAVLGIFSGVEVGSLVITDEASGVRHTFGQAVFHKEGDSDGTNGMKTVPKVEILVKDEFFWLRLLLLADIGFAESYMLGDIECSDLVSFFRLFIMNKHMLNDGTTPFSALSSMASRLGRSSNTPSNSLLNAAAHYDVSNDMFAAFLSDDMTYSCPIWRSASFDVTTNDVETLEDAQQTKLLRFIDGAKLKASDHVLEIGTGWGSFAIEAVRRTGCRVTTITLSRKQLELAQHRIKLAGLGHRIEVKFMDYRELFASAETFDKIVSIEMIEAVGEAHLEEYFAGIHKLLKQEGGIAMFQCITIPEALHQADKQTMGFIDQYIFPGGYLPSTIQLLNHISMQSKGSLVLERVENIGCHYTRALRLWRETFLLNFDDKIRPALLDSYPEMSKEAIQVFHRKWEVRMVEPDPRLQRESAADCMAPKYYFAYCEAGFVTKTLCDVIITVARAGALELMEGVPL